MSRRRTYAALGGAALIIAAGFTLINGPASASCLPGQTPQAGDANQDCIPDPPPPTQTPGSEPTPTPSPVAFPGVPRAAFKVVGHAIDVRRTARTERVLCPAGQVATTGGYSLSNDAWAAPVNRPVLAGDVPIGWEVRVAPPLFVYRSRTTALVYAVCVPAG